MMILISVELFRWLVHANVSSFQCQGIEMGQQMRLVLLWIAYGIYVHQGAPLKSAVAEGGVPSSELDRETQFFSVCVEVQEQV